MSKPTIDFGQATASVRRQNSEDKTVAYYTVNVKGENGLTGLARLTPEKFDEAFGPILEERLLARLEGLRGDFETAVEKLRDSVGAARTEFNGEVRGWQFKLGIGNASPAPKETPPAEGTPATEEELAP